MSEGDASDSVHVTHVAINSYAGGENWPDIEAETESRRIIRLLSSHVRTTVHAWDRDPTGRDLGAVVARLQNWAAHPTSDVSMLIWIGHGESNDRDAALLVPTQTDSTENSEIGPDFIAKLLETYQARSEQGVVFFVVEACGAGRFVELVAAQMFDRGSPEGVLLIGSGSARGSGFLGGFGNALARALDSYSDNDLQIHPRDLAARIEDFLEPGRLLPIGLAQVRPMERLNVIPVSVTATVDAYLELRRLVSTLPDAERRHFVRKGMGSDFGELTWRFVGRESEIKRISEWLNGDEDLLLVTGAPGSGKSALLGNIVIRSRPDVVRALGSVGAGRLLGDLQSLIEPVTIDLSLNLNGMSPREVMSVLLDAVGYGSTEVSGDTNELFASLRSSLSNRLGGLTILADALDESRDPLGIADYLAALAKLSGVRVIVGSRPSLLSALDSDAGDDHRLIKAFEDSSARTRTLYLHRDPSAMAGYLRQAVEVPDTDSLRDGLERVITRVRGDRNIVAESRGFLFTRLVVQELNRDPALLEGDHRGQLEELLSCTHAELFARFVDRLVFERPTEAALLFALSFGEGRGLPLTDRIWVAVASLLLARDVTTRDVTAMLERTSGYVLLDAEDGQTVYRLAHRTFEEYLRAQASRIAFTLSRTVRSTETLHTSILDTLLSLVTATSLTALNPYLRRRLPQHAAAARENGWQALAARPALLDVLDAEALASECLESVRLGVAVPTVIRALAASRYMLVAAGGADRQGLRQLASCRYGDAPGETVDVTTWSVKWASLARQSFHVRLAVREEDGSMSSPNSVKAIATLVDRNGDPVIITGGDDGSVRVWDGRSGALLRAELVKHGWDEVTWISVFRDDRGHDIVVSAGIDRTVRMTDLATGEPQGPPLRHLAPVVLAEVQPPWPRGRVLLTIDMFNIATLWDLASGRRFRRIDRHVSLTAYIFFRPRLIQCEGELFVVTPSLTGAPVIWDPFSGKLLRWSARRKIRRQRGVLQLATYTEDDASSGIATCNLRRSLQYWGPDGLAREWVHPIDGYMINAMTAFPTPDGKMRVALHNSGVVEILEASKSGVCVTAALSTENDISCLRWFEIPGGDRFLIGGGYHGADVWSLDSLGEQRTGSSPRPRWRLGAPFSAVHQATDAQGKVWIIGAANGDLHIWGENDGRQVRVLPEAGFHVSSIASLVDETGRSLIAAQGRSDEVRVWDLHTGDVVKRIKASILSEVCTVKFDDVSLLGVVESHGDAIAVWDPVSGERIMRDRKMGSVAANPPLLSDQGELLTVVSVKAGGLQLFDIRAELPAGPPLAEGLFFRTLLGKTRSGRILLLTWSSFTQGIKLWDPRTGHQVCDLDFGEKIYAVNWATGGLVIGLVSGVAMVNLPAGILQPDESVEVPEFAPDTWGIDLDA